MEANLVVVCSCLLSPFKKGMQAPHRCNTVEVNQGIIRELTSMILGLVGHRVKRKYEKNIEIG
jgi:hypothetical protein